MLKRLITVTNTNEIVTSSVIDVVDSLKIDLNTGMDDVALKKLFSQNAPGTQIPLSTLPYIYSKYMVIVSGSGQLSYYPETSILIDYDIKYYDNETYLATLDESGKIVTHSKYVLDTKGNSGKGGLANNKLFVEPVIIVPTLIQ